MYMPSLIYIYIYRWRLIYIYIYWKMTPTVLADSYLSRKLCQSQSKKSAGFFMFCFFVFFWYFLSEVCFLYVCGNGWNKCMFYVCFSMIGSHSLSHWDIPVVVSKVQQLTQSTKMRWEPLIAFWEGIHWLLEFPKFSHSHLKQIDLHLHLFIISIIGNHWFYWFQLSPVIWAHRSHCFWRNDH